MRPCSSQTRGVSAGKAANQTHLCLRHGFIGLSHDNFGAIEREIETMLELNDGKITVDLDKKKTTVLPFKNMVSYSHPKASPDPSQIKWFLVCLIFRIKNQMTNCISNTLW